MADVELKFEVEADDDGYVSYECPFCKSTFSLKASEVQGDDPIYNEMYCPYCGLNDKPSNFYTKEVIEQAQNIAMIWTSLNSIRGVLSLFFDVLNFGIYK